MISDKVHEQRLRKKDAVIVTDYYDSGTAKIRSTDHKRADDVRSGVILAKKYYMHGKMLHQETEFNPGMLYSFVFPVLDNGEVQCPNCGATGDNALFSEGCPYCGTFYNMDYQSEVLGERNHSDYVTEEKKNLFLPLVLIMVVCVAVGVFLTVSTGRTSTVFDYAKGALLGGMAGGIVYLIYSSYKSRATLTSEEIKKKHEQDIILERFNKDLKENGLTLGSFFNNLNLGLRDYYFGSDSAETKDIIDFDILDYRDQYLTRQDDNVFVTTGATIRIVSTDGDKVWSEQTNKKIRMKKSSKTGPDHHSGMNIKKCPFCGASIDLTAKRCSYCGTTFRYERPLYIVDVM